MQLPWAAQAVFFSDACSRATTHEVGAVRRETAGYLAALQTVDTPGELRRVEEPARELALKRPATRSPRPLWAASASKRRAP